MIHLIPHLPGRGDDLVSFFLADSAFSGQRLVDGTQGHTQMIGNILDGHGFLSHCAPPFCFAHPIPGETFLLRINKIVTQRPAGSEQEPAALRMIIMVCR